MQAVGREFAGWDVVSHVACGGTGLDQVGDESVQLLVGSDDMATAVEYCREVSVVIAVRHPRETEQNGLELFGGACDTVSDLFEFVQVAGDLPFVPCGQDRIDVGKVLVQRRPADSCLPGYLRHRHRREPVLGDQGRGRVQRGVAHRRAVRRDRLAPQLRHELSMTHRPVSRQFDLTETHCIDKTEEKFRGNVMWQEK